jgi:putative component of membrane protein insertase Oxa1/YidC/SpoIIIJ protein YidD
VIALVQAGLSEQIIISKMRTSKCRFDTSTNALIQLKNAGASDGVMLAITNAQCGS